MNRYDYIAERHGVIVGAGATPAAAAAAAARVSRCDVRLATPMERRMARLIGENGRQRPLPGDERGLLEAIHIDITRLLWMDSDPFDAEMPDLVEYRAIYNEHLRFDEWTHLGDADRRALERRREAVYDDIDELDALANQIDAFRAPLQAASGLVEAGP